jgi:hypothetical protein
MISAADLMISFHKESTDINNMVRGITHVLGPMLKHCHEDGTPYWARVVFPDKTFTHDSVEKWVKSQSRGGLGMSIAYLFSILDAHDNLMGAGNADPIRKLLADNGVTPAKGQVEKAPVIRRNGRPSKGDGNIDNVKVTAGGNSAEYLLSKLNRDYPDVAKGYAEGKFKSVRAAAMSAGIVKQATTLEQLLKLWSKASEEERLAFMVEVKGGAA